METPTINNVTESVRAADHLIDLLVSQGIKQVYGVPGESYLPVLDAIYGRENEIKFITCRQEGGAAMAADANGKLTGRPGVCFVTRGPGATNASAGVHIAFQDSTPMILFIGQVARNMTEREAFQEIDYRRMFGQMAKWVAEIDDANRIQEFVIRAIRTAMSGRPGPVVLSLPEDMLYDTINTPPAPAWVSAPRYVPASNLMNELKSLIEQAERPLIMVGGGSWTKHGIEALAVFAQKQGIPVTSSFRCQSLMNNDHPNYVGHFSVGQTPYLSEALQQTDLLIAVGPRLGEMTTSGYTSLQAPVPQQTLVHIFPAAEEIGRVFEPALSLTADTESFCCLAAVWEPITSAKFVERTNTLRMAYEEFNNPQSIPDDPIAPYFDHMNEVLPEDAIFANGAGNYSGWIHRFIRYRSAGSQLAPTSGSMGYGLPGAVGAATTSPEREVFAFAGDGCFMMTCQEMATACHHNLRITVIVIDNGRYGTIRAHQEREYPMRVSGTNLSNPDFCALAKSFGAGAEKVNNLADFKERLAMARSRGGVNLIEIPLDQSILAPGKRLSS